MNFLANMIARDDKIMLTYLSLDIDQTIRKKCIIHFHPEDNDVLVDVELQDEIINVNKFLTNIVFKKLLLYRRGITDKWSELYDSDDGILYIDTALSKDTSCKFLVMWIVESDKKFKIWIEGSIRLEIRASTHINIGELTSLIKKTYSLGKYAI